MALITLPHGLTLRDYQQSLWDAMVVQNTRDALVIWPRRNGKDLVTLNIVVAKAMQRVGFYLYVAPFYSQIRTIIWEGADNEGRRFLDYIPPGLIKQKYESRMTIELINGSYIKFGGSDNFDSMMGGNPVGIVRTEASLHKPEGWQYLSPILVGNQGWAIHNGTPRGMNHFYTMAEMAKKDPLFFFQHLTCLDTGSPTIEEIQREREKGMPESMIQQEYYCSFLASNESTLIPLDIIEPCLNTILTEDQYTFEPRIIGVDPAFSAKGDKAIIAKRQGRLLHPLKKFKGVDNMALANEIAKEIRAWRPHAVMIDAGRGEGVISRLIQLGYDELVIPVNFGGGAENNTLYLNKRAEIWCRMRDWFVKGALAGASPQIPKDQDLIMGLSTPMLDDSNSRNLMQVESKKSIRSRGAYLMDEPDAVAVTFAEEIQGDNPGAGRYGPLRDALEGLDDDESDNPNLGYDPLCFFNKKTNKNLKDDNRKWRD